MLPTALETMEVGKAASRAAEPGRARLTLVNHTEAVKAVLLTGTIGSGKTALAVELGDVLGGRGLATAVIDLDWLGWWHAPAGTPSSPADLIVRNLEAVWPNFRAEGARFVVLARMLQERSEIDALRKALPDADLTVVRVEAPHEIVEKRLRQRDTGAELAGHLKELAGMQRRVTELSAEDLRIENGDRSIADVATELLDRLGWL
jgi:adenylylsulfate kinase-like enzyme